MFVSEEPLKKTTLLVVSCSFFYWKRNSRSKLHVGFKEKKTMVVHSKNPKNPKKTLAASRVFQKQREFLKPQSGSWGSSRSEQQNGR